MNLLTAELRSALARFPLGSQEGLGDRAKVLVKFFFPAGRYTFFVTEAERQEEDILFFGFCLSPFGEDSDEWGYTSLSELQSVRIRGLTMERDLHLPFATHTVAELRRHAA
jgi:hypothetical protein